MAGQSQHRDNRSSYFSTDLGRSGIYDSVNGTPFNFSQRGDNPNNLRNIDGISETARESGLYASRIGSTKQPTEDYSKEGMLGSTGHFPRQNWDQSFKEGNITPDSGTYSRNIESNQYDTDYKANNDIGRSSTFDNTRDSGLYNSKIGSFRETIPDKDMATPFPDNFGLDNQRQSSKHSKPNKYTGNSLETMLEGDDESKQPEHYNSTFYSESRKVLDTGRITDYDGHSNASFQDDKEMPSWTNMLFDRQFTDDYIKKTWPKITLPLANTRKNDPFAPGTDDEGSNTIDEKSGTHDHKVRNTLCVIGFGTLLLCLVGAAIITIALIANQRTVKVNMTVAIDKTFTAELNDPNSPEYKNFTTEFCDKMKNVYASTNSSVDGYYGCKVNQLTNGSIIVNYFIYFISTANQQVTTSAVSATLTTHLTVSGTQLGTLVFIISTIIVHDVVTETLESPPVVEQIATTTTIPTMTSTGDTTSNTMQPATETTTPSITSPRETTPKTVQSTTETTTPSITSPSETTPKTVQSTTKTTTPSITTPEKTTPKTVQSTTETTTPSITSHRETTPKTVQSTTETTPKTVQSTTETTPKTVQSTTETTTPSITTPGETKHKTVQPTTETTTSSITSPRETTPKTVQSTTETTTSSITSPRDTTHKTVQPTTKTTTSSITSPRETTHKTVQPTTETTTSSITSPRETTHKTVQPTTETTSSSITSTRETTHKTVQPTTETTTSSITSPREATHKTVQPTTETTTSSITSPRKTIPNTEQSSTETTAPSISSPGETALKGMQSTTDITTPSITSTGETTQKTVQSTTDFTTPSIFSTDEITTTNMQSTTGTSTPSILLTEQSTPKTMQSTTETTIPSISSTKETTPTSMQFKTSSPSISSTEESPQKTMQSTKETTLSSISTTLEQISSPPTPQVSEETTKQTFKTTEGTSTSIETEISTTQDKNSNKVSTITTPVKVTSPFIDSTIKETSKSPTTYKTPEMTTSSVTSKPAYDSTTSVATMLNAKSTTPSITQPTTKTVTVTDYISPTMVDITARTTHKSFLSETTSPFFSTKIEIQTTFTQNKETTTSVAVTDQTNASVKVSTITDTTSRSTALQEDMTSSISEDETTVSASRIYTSSDKTSSARTTTSEAPSSKETTATVDNIPTTTAAYEPSSDGTSTTLTPSSAELNCTDAVEADLYSGPVNIECTIIKSEEFEYIGISHENGFDNTIYGVSVYKNGTIFKTYKENQDISISIESTSTIKLIITFINVTCTMDGSYKVSLISNSSGEMNEIIGVNVLLKIRSPTGKPTVTLSVDQVIDLVFPDGNYYRGSGIHTCEGLIGEPPAKLEIDITYNNGTSFAPISNSNIHLVSRTNTSDECSTKETLSFGLKFSPEMDGARLRCRVSDSLTEYTLSEELNLIPRNICDCSASFSYRGHPSNCKVQVYCVTEGGIAYPRGIACASNQCRNSITGVCSNDCSATVCNETVPSDFCTTPAPPTTTPAPSPYIVCTDTTAIINSGPSVITCHLNDTATFTVMNVTYMKLGTTDVQQLALIDEDNTVTMFAMEGIVSIIMSNNIINITILDSSCTNEGTFAVVTNINGETIKDQGKFSVISKPNGDADLQLHPDQIAGLLNYRTWLLHSCIINVGYPPGEISIEMMKQDETEFNNLNVIIHATDDDIDNTTCSYVRTTKFGFDFTADMDKAIMRCTVTHDLFTVDDVVYSNNETVSLIPIDFCKNNTVPQSYHPHQKNCNSFIQCEGEVTYGQPCPSNLCFGVTETNGCNFCDQAICPADITTTPVPESSTFASSIEETTTPEPMSSIDVFCNSSTVIWNSGPVDMVCKLNTTDFNVLNVTFRSSTQVIPTIISQIQSNGNIHDLIQDDGVIVTYVGQLVTISILNASCSSGDFYGLMAVDINGKAEGQAEGKLIVGSIPSDAVLTLHPDQNADLAYRNWLLHICEADVGYPPGEVQFEILNEGEAEFTVLDANIVTSNDESGSCSVTKKVEFGIDFTANMDKAIIRCSVKSTLYPENPVIYSNNDTVSLIPSDFCESHNATYNPHTINCNYYIQCQGNTVYGQKCQSSLCFGITQRDGCDFCFNAICPSDITTTAKPETTVPVPSIDVSCTGTSVLLNTGPTNIVCVVNTTSFGMMNVTFTKSSGVNPSLIARIESDGRVIYTNFSDQIVVQYASSTVTVTIQNASCPYEGFYGVAVDNGNGLTGRKDGQLSVTAKPSGPLEFKIHPEQIAGLNTVRSEKLHSCTGTIGDPGGTIGVEILLDGDDNFQTYEPSFKSISDTHENCTIYREFKFWIAFTAAMNNATIRCKITNDEYPTDPPINSNNENLALVPDDFCNRNYNGTNLYQHPTDCNRIVTCVEKVTYVGACLPGLCFDPTIVACNFCYRVDSCP
ncbi:mucin-3B-like isoform X2 [Mytilus trossulus]|uniref:mucin-3B-like isoform X2 n=1 Tax=Mytilus trossulus TaxID=6551 RepID=UPI003005BF1C